MSCADALIESMRAFRQGAFPAFEAEDVVAEAQPDQGNESHTFEEPLEGEDAFDAVPDQPPVMEVIDLPLADIDESFTSEEGEAVSPLEDVKPPRPRSAKRRTRSSSNCLKSKTRPLRSRWLRMPASRSGRSSARAGRSRPRAGGDLPGGGLRPYRKRGRRVTALDGGCRQQLRARSTAAGPAHPQGWRTDGGYPRDR